MKNLQKNTVSQKIFTLCTVLSLTVVGCKWSESDILEDEDLESKKFAILIDNPTSKIRIVNAADVGKSEVKIVKLETSDVQGDYVFKAGKFAFQLTSLKFLVEGETNEWKYDGKNYDAVKQVFTAQRKKVAKQDPKDDKDKEEDKETLDKDEKAKKDAEDKKKDTEVKTKQLQPIASSICDEAFQQTVKFDDAAGVCNALDANGIVKAISYKTALVLVPNDSLMLYTKWIFQRVESLKETNENMLAELPNNLCKGAGGTVSEEDENKLKCTLGSVSKSIPSLKAGLTADSAGTLIQSLVLGK